jgi:hypothetical protein
MMNSDFLNNADANAALLAATQAADASDDYVNLAAGNGLMYSQNYLEIYSDILNNMKIDTSVVKSEDKQINDVLGDYVKQYLEGSDYDTAIDGLKSYIHDTFSYLNIQ